MKKQYHIVESGKGYVKRWPGVYSNKRYANAIKRMIENRLRSLDVIYWVDFEWA